MKSLRIFLSFLLVFCIAVACGEDSADNTETGDTLTGMLHQSESATMPALAGIYDVTGTDNIGTYTGQVEFRPDGPSGGLKFIRVIEYDSLPFNDYTTARSIWAGQVLQTAGQIQVQIKLRQAHWITAYDGLVRGEDQKHRLIVTGQFNTTKGDLSGAYSSAGDIVTGTESLTYSAANGAEPIWGNQDYYFESHEEPSEGFKTLLDMLLADYHALPFYDDYRDRPEFKRYVHYMGRFRNHFDFYRENPDKLSLYNNVIDSISLFEAQRRAEAYKYSLEEKAEYFDAITPEFTVNEHGMLAAYVLGTEEPYQHNYDYDSLLWTGTYVAGQAYRYMVTGEPEALENMLFSLNGLITCVEITGDPTTFARTLRTIDVKKADDKYDAWTPGTGQWAGIEWRCCGNNDMLHGIFYGYAAALMALPDESQYDALRQRMIDTAVSLTTNCPVVTEDMGNPVPMNLLCYALTGDTAYWTAYQEAFDLAVQAWNWLGGGMFYAYGVSDWSGQHLNTVTMQTISLLSEYLNEPIPGSVMHGYSWGMYLTRTIPQALFTLSAYAFSTPDPMFDPLLEDSIWVLREIPVPKRSYAWDMRITDEWTASPLPSLFWKFDWVTGGRHQGLYSTPMFMHGDTSCFWKDYPLDFSGGTSLDTHSGADFLHAYWLGKLYGVIDGSE